MIYSIIFWINRVAYYKKIMWLLRITGGIGGPGERMGNDYTNEKARKKT